MNNPKLLEQIRAGRGQLEAALEQLSDAELLAPSLPGRWSIKDLLAHLGWWEQRVVNTYHTLLRGDIPDPEADTLRVDELNARVFKQYQNWTLPDVRREENKAYQAIVSLVENAPEEDLFHPNRFAWTEGQPFVDWIRGNTYEHYEEHLKELQKLSG